MNERKRNLVYGANMITMIALVIGILGAINWISTKHYKRWEPFKSESDSLSPQTVNVLKSLKDKVTVTHFFTESYDSMGNEDLEQLKTLLERYKSINPKFDYEMIDYVKNPLRVNHFVEGSKKINLEANDSVVQFGDRVEKVADSSETALTQAIIKVTTGIERGVCFTEGHGEHDTDLSDVGGYGVAAQALGAENYSIKKIDVAMSGIPEACDVIVVGGPMAPFKEEEALRLKKWVDDGGKLLVLLEPTGATGLEALLADYGIELEDNVLKLDKADSVGIDPLEVYSEDYDPSHPITADLSQMRLLTGEGMRKMPMRMFSARSLKVEEAVPNGAETTRLITSYEVYRGYSSEGMKGGISGSLGANQGGKALTESMQFVVAATALKKIEGESAQATPEADAGEKTERSTRIAVFGDSDWVSDGYLQDRPNGDVLLNTIAWLAVEEASIGIRPKDKKFEPIHFGGANNWIKLGLILLLVPSALLLNAFLVWREKKKM